MTPQNNEHENQIKGANNNKIPKIDPTKKAEKKDNRVVVAYARTSTQMQEKGLESQIRAIREYCKQHNITDYLLYSDEGISGTKNSRPALDKMMTAVKDGKVSKVIVYSFSRYARSTNHLLNALTEFKKMNVEFSSISERIDTNSPLGVAMYAILGAVSQLERDILAERVRNGLANARAKGIKIGRKKTRDSALIRKLYTSGMTYRQISRASGASNGSIAAEIREMKKELKDKEELDKTMKEREYKSVKDELDKARKKMMNLESKLSPEQRNIPTSTVSQYIERPKETNEGEPSKVSI